MEKFQHCCHYLYLRDFFWPNQMFSSLSFYYFIFLPSWEIHFDQIENLLCYPLRSYFPFESPRWSHPESSLDSSSASHLVKAVLWLRKEKKKEEKWAYKLVKIVFTWLCEEVVVFYVILELLYFELTHMGAKVFCLKIAKLIALFGNLLLWIDFLFFLLL